MKLIMTKGLPASGKTTWAKEQVDTEHFVRVNKDDLRKMIHNGKWSMAREALIISVRNDIVNESLSRNLNVIVDDTNFEPRHETVLQGFAQDWGAEFEIKDFTDVPINVCIERNKQRPNPVPEKVIYQMYEKYLKKEFIEKPRVEGLRNAIIVDIDGTIAIHPHRGHYDYSQVSGDLPRKEIINIVNSYACQGVKVIIVSGRDDSCMDDTYKWLRRQCVLFDDVFMRKTGDKRQDSIIKQEIYDNFIKDKYNVRLVLDDRNQVVDMWRANGLVTLQVAEGNF